MVKIALRPGDHHHSGVGRDFAFLLQVQGQDAVVVPLHPLEREVQSQVVHLAGQRVAGRGRFLVSGQVIHALLLNAGRHQYAGYEILLR